MSVKYLSDSLGNKTDVVIPMLQWKKILKKYSGIEKEVEGANLELDEEEFREWINSAEQSEEMSLDQFNAKWEQKKQQLQNLSTLK